MTDYNYQCNYCGHHFVHEERYLKHRCKAMIRDEEFRTVKGQAAWSFYKSWMKAQRRMVPKDRSYLKSKYFNAFMRFADYVQKMHIADTDAFIWLMKEKDLPPTIWTNGEVYDFYLEFMDRKVSPDKLVKITINALFKEAEDRDIKVGDLFDHLKANELIMLLRRRQVSPWVLLNSKKFKQFFINNTTHEEQLIINSIIKFQYWDKRFNENPKLLENIRLYVKELNL